MITPLSVCQYVSMSVGKCVFSKTAHRVFLKLLMKLGAVRVKIWLRRIFWEKCHFEDNALKHPKNKVLDFAKKDGLLMCVFFEFRSCTIMTFVILLKLHVLEKSVSWVKCKNALGQSDCRIFRLWYLKDQRSYKADFWHAGT